MGGPGAWPHLSRDRLLLLRPPFRHSDWPAAAQPPCSVAMLRPRRRGVLGGGGGDGGGGGGEGGGGGRRGGEEGGG